MAAAEDDMDQADVSRDDLESYFRGPTPSCI
jgi:hypothetical protein